MSQDKAYDPKITENKWSAFWEQLALFKANSQSNKPPFSLVIPPPNVTGVLHMGHALVNTLQDVMVRFKRMDGFEALWVPGTDHAGIATQTVVERHLMETLGKRRSDMPREEFLEHVWAWKEKSEKSSSIRLNVWAALATSLGNILPWMRIATVPCAQCLRNFSTQALSIKVII